MSSNEKEPFRYDRIARAIAYIHIHDDGLGWRAFESELVEGFLTPREWRRLEYFMNRPNHRAYTVKDLLIDDAKIVDDAQKV